MRDSIIKSSMHRRNNKKYILSIYFGFHDSCITFSSLQEILLHLEAERVFRKKHIRVTREEMLKLIQIGLHYLNINISNIETILLSKWNNQFESEQINIFGKNFKPIMTSHHMNHIGTIMPENFEDSLIVCADGGSEDGTTKLYLKNGSKINLIEDLNNTIMTGKFYGTITQMIIDPRFGRAHDSYPGKTMGLSAYGNYSPQLAKLIQKNLKELNTLHFNGCAHLLKKFKLSSNYHNPWKDRARRDLASTAQYLWQEKFLKKILSYSYLSKNISLVGGCALNILLNQAILDSNRFDNVYLTPVSSDCGQSLGAILFHFPQIKCSYPYLGRGFGKIKSLNSKFFDDLFDHKIIAWYQGRSEIGPRALGHRSFIGLADSPNMKHRLSVGVKKREPYRPISPIITSEDLSSFFKTKNLSPYMTFAPTARKITKQLAPAIVHKDGTSRVQTLDRKSNPILHNILLEVKKRTGCPILMNSSFNIAGEPIVDTPEDALKSFLKSNADILYINGKRYAKNN